MVMDMETGVHVAQRWYGASQKGHRGWASKRTGLARIEELGKKEGKKSKEEKEEGKKERDEGKEEIEEGKEDKDPCYRTRNLCVSFRMPLAARSVTSR